MLPKVKHSELFGFFDLAIATQENLLMVSEPGVGKTYSVKDYCEEKSYDLIIDHPAVSDPTDYKGLPAVSNQTIEVVQGNEIDDLLAGIDNNPVTMKVAEFLPFNNLVKIMTATKTVIWFIDDFGQAPASVQAALMQFLGSRELAGKKIPDCVHIFAATNGREHKSGVKGLLEAVKSRFGVIIQLVPDLDSFNDWMIKHYPKASPICDYLNFEPAALSDFKTDQGMENSPNPRLWEKVAKYLSHLTDWDSEFMKKVCSSCVGQSYGEGFYTFLKVYKVIPTYADIVSDPENHPIDQTMDVRHAMLGMLAVQGQKRHHKEIFTFIEKLKKPFQVIFVRALCSRRSPLLNTPSLRSWQATNSDIYMQAISSAKSGIDF